MGRLGCLHSHLLSPARRKDVVDNATRSFCSRVPRLSRKEPTCWGSTTDQSADPRRLSFWKRYHLKHPHRRAEARNLREGIRRISVTKPAKRKDYGL